MHLTAIRYPDRHDPARIMVARVAPDVSALCQAIVLSRSEVDVMAESADPPSDPADGRRRPTSHERLTGQPWDASYQDGPPPWDVGRPQPAVVRLAAAGRLAGEVLDVGCGSGDNALHLAARGAQVVGVDVAGTALEAARGKAGERGLSAQFLLVDALDLGSLGRRFPTVLDCALFHTLDSEEQSTYASSLAAVTQPRARIHLLCFSDQGPDTGPHPVSRAQLEETFGDHPDLRLVSVQPERLLTRFHDDKGAPAWSATIERR